MMQDLVISVALGSVAIHGVPPLCTPLWRVPIRVDSDSAAGVTAGLATGAVIALVWPKRIVSATVQVGAHVTQDILWQTGTRSSAIVEVNGFPNRVPN